MKAVVHDGCIACGLCTSVCPEVFRMGEDMAEAYAEVTKETEEDAKEARDACPVSVIDIDVS